MPIAESVLMVKGAMAIAHWLTAHGTTAMASKAGTMIVKSLATQGFANTFTAVTTIATSASLGVGCILWTTERLKLAEEGLQAIYDGDTNKMVRKFAKLALKLDIDFDMLPDAVEDMLTEKADFSYEDAHEIAQLIQKYEEEINERMNKKRK